MYIIVNSFTDDDVGIYNEVTIYPEIYSSLEKATNKANEYFKESGKNRKELFTVPATIEDLDGSIGKKVEIAYLVGARDEVAACFYHDYFAVVKLTKARE